jgi:hypothetical protein
MPAPRRWGAGLLLTGEVQKWTFQVIENYDWLTGTWCSLTFTIGPLILPFSFSQELIVIV